MPEIVDKVASDKKGIGYSFNSYCSKMYVNENARIISVDGKNIDDEDYPLLFEVYLIKRSGEETVKDVAGQVIRFAKLFYCSLGVIILLIGLYNKCIVLPKLEKEVGENSEVENKIKKTKNKSNLMIIATLLLFFGVFILSIIRHF